MKTVDRERIAELRPSNTRAALSVTTITLNGVMGFVFSFRSEWALVLLGQLQLTILVWHCFSLVHSCGHGTYFRNQRLNIVCGHLASIFSFIPFYGWKYHHHLHHVWVGHESNDPSISSTAERPGPRMMGFLNVCWKLWVPIFSLYYAAFNYWGTSHLFRFVKNPLKRRKIRFSIAWLVVVHAGIWFSFGPGILLSLIFPALIFLATSDVILTAQHLFLDSPEKRYSGNRPLRTSEQNPLSRTIYSNRFFDRYVLLNLNLHNAHHAYPQVAHYHLARLGFSPAVQVPASTWISQIKSMRVEQLFFGDSL